MAAVACPECDSALDIDIDEIEEGETLTCDDCGAELEVISLDPLEIFPVDPDGYDDEVTTPEDVDEDDE